jgi:ferredoxin/flavodoxin---NADP+ reductase
MTAQQVSSPIRVAIIGAGPAGFYGAEALLKSEDPVVEVDMFDRLPTPFGLVRSGVAPDHQKIKNVTRVFENIAKHPRFRFYGNVCFGEHLKLEDFEAHYHQILFTTGAQTDRNLDIPGETLAGSHSATEFVAWYNGHPEFRDRKFDLTQERAVVVGVGNVAMDVARILMRTQEELQKTDIAEHAMVALRDSKVREVVMLGRRGPAQAAFTLPELKELGHMADADVVVYPDEVALDPISKAALEASDDRQLHAMVALLQEYANRPASGRSRRVVLRFLVSPVELLGDQSGHLQTVRIVRNELVESRGRVSPRATDKFEQFDAGLIFRSVGYRGVALSGVPFREDWGTIPNEVGRVVSTTGQAVRGLYVAGWIKRGPSGVVGTNKPDAQETVVAMLEDIRRGETLQPTTADRLGADAAVRSRQPKCFSFDDWRRLDEHELAMGKAAGRPRVKLTCLEDMLAALEQRAEAAAAK